LFEVPPSRDRKYILPSTAVATEKTKGVCSSLDRYNDNFKSIIDPEGAFIANKLTLLALVQKPASEFLGGRAIICAGVDVETLVSEIEVVDK
jgi:hypothetical protein